MVESRLKKDIKFNVDYKQCKSRDELRDELVVAAHACPLSSPEKDP